MQASLSTNMAFILWYRVDIRNSGPVFGVQPIVVSLCYTSIRAGIVVSISFQKVDRAPNSEAGAERDHEGLEDTNCTVKKSHIL